MGYESRAHERAMMNNKYYKGDLEMKIENIVDLSGFDFAPVNHKEMKSILRSFEDALEDVYIEYKNSWFMSRTKVLIKMQSVCKRYKVVDDYLDRFLEESSKEELNQFMLELLNIQLKCVGKIIDSDMIKRVAKECYDSELKQKLFKTEKKNDNEPNTNQKNNNLEEEERLLLEIAELKKELEILRNNRK